MKQGIIFVLLLVCFGCASRAPIDRAATFNKSLVKSTNSLSRFSKYSGVEDEQSQLKEASAWFARDIGLVKDCLKHRGGITNPICRADKTETAGRVTWITASADRGMVDIDKNPAANAKTKKAAHRTFSAIQASAQKTIGAMDHGGLLVTRYNTAHMPRPPLDPYNARPPFVAPELPPVPTVCTDMKDYEACIKALK